MKIAILGATGHLARCAFRAFSMDGPHEFYLFSRSADRLAAMYAGSEQTVRMGSYRDFPEGVYDIIFNGVGCWDDGGTPPRSIFSVTEEYDALILRYQLRHPDARAVHVSSGAVYGGSFSEPVSESTKALIPVNALREGDFYQAAKLNAEAKHRAFPELGIVDLRLFGFFSRFMSLDYGYFLSAAIRSAREGKVFRQVPGEFWRDYIHPEDFAALLRAAAYGERINAAVDVRSAKPISKSEIIELFVSRYGLRVETDPQVPVSRTGAKPFYYSTRENPLYTPLHTSLETLRDELHYFMGGEL